MKITWEVDDGYCRGSAPQYTIIDDDELKEYETETEKEEFIREVIQDDFNETISWHETDRE